MLFDDVFFNFNSCTKSNNELNIYIQLARVWPADSYVLSSSAVTSQQKKTGRVIDVNYWAEFVTAYSIFSHAQLDVLWAESRPWQQHNCTKGIQPRQHYRACCHCCWWWSLSHTLGSNAENIEFRPAQAESKQQLARLRKIAAAMRISWRPLSTCQFSSQFFTTGK